MHINIDVSNTSLSHDGDTGVKDKEENISNSNTKNTNTNLPPLPPINDDDAKCYGSMKNTNRNDINVNNGNPVHLLSTSSELKMMNKLVKKGKKAN